MNLYCACLKCALSTLQTVSHQSSSPSCEMLVTGNICNCIQLSEAPPGLEGTSVMWESAALWVEKRWKLWVFVLLSVVSISFCLRFHQLKGIIASMSPHIAAVLCEWLWVLSLLAFWFFEYLLHARRFQSLLYIHSLNTPQIPVGWEKLLILQISKLKYREFKEPTYGNTVIKW